MTPPVPRQVGDWTPLGVYGMQQGPRTPPYVKGRYFPAGAYAGPAQPIFQPRFVGCPIAKPGCDGYCTTNGGVHGLYQGHGYLASAPHVTCPSREFGCDGVCTMNGGLHGLRKDFG